MSIDMYLSDSQAQATAAWTMADSEMQAYADIEVFLSTFESSADQLKGQAYDSARAYVGQVLKPLVRGGRLLSEAIGTAIKRFPEAYVEEVAAESLKESELLRDIQSLDSEIALANQNISDLGKGELSATDESRLTNYQNIVSSATESRRLLQEKLDKLRNFNNSSPQIFSEIASLKSLVDQGLAQLGNGWNAEQGVYVLPTDLTWATNLNHMSPMNPYVTEEMLDFYNSLPEEIKGVVTINDIRSTDDNFFIIEKPVSDILKSLGKTEVMVDGSPVPVDLVYDDHFIYGVGGENGYSYSVLKMRELGDNQGGHGVSIPFISTGIDGLFDFSNTGPTITDQDHFYNEFQRLVADEGQEADRTILDYFKKTESQANYLIADLYTSKVIQDNGSNTINSAPLDNKLTELKKWQNLLDEMLKPTYPRSPNGGDLQMVLSQIEEYSRIPDYLIELNQKAGYNIYDPETGDITVKDPNNLTHYERQAILAVSTGNVNYNSFSAEVEFHADAVDDWKSSIPFLGSLHRESGIRADMGLGEEAESGVFDKYYNLEDESVKRQEEIHGQR